MTVSFTGLLYFDPILTEFEATVVAVDVDSGLVVLNSTAFYPRGGGQAGDTGCLDGMRIIDTTWSADHRYVIHHADPAHAILLRPGAAVAGRIDRDRRDALTGLHTAQHLAYLATVAVLGDPLAPVAGGDISPFRARLDLEWPASRGPFPAGDVERVVGEFVAADLDIHRYPDVTGSSRWWWAIDGQAPIPCGGTHLHSTGAVGAVTVSAKRKGGRLVRVTVAATAGSPDTSLLARGPDSLPLST